MVGGKRAGAGRPKMPPGEALVKITTRLPAEYVAWAKAEGRGNLALGLRRLLEELDQRQGADAQK